MAELIYDENGRLLFTKEMRQEYTILMPQMVPTTFALFSRVLELNGYKAEMLNTFHRGIVDTGLKYVHNDTCYPALLVIGQLIDAVNSGRYDKHKVALMVTQSGGGCRASNYIHLLRKALKKAGLEYIPVISMNMSGFEKNPGFTLSLDLIRKLIPAMLYGDLLMWLGNQCRPYELTPGITDNKTQHWIDQINTMFEHNKGITRKDMGKTMETITADFASIPRSDEKKPRVGIVGEIYVKFSPLGNNNLEDFLKNENCEPVLPGLTDFIIFKVNNRVVDVDLYKGSKLKKAVCLFLQTYIEKSQRVMIDAVKTQPCFRPMGSFADLQEVIKGYLGYGNKMGEGWLLTAEMLELIHSGANNIVCTQPFGCLPNHVVGKGMIRRLKDDYPDSNIVAIDYDPGATRINQENRIKLMLANANDKLKAMQKPTEKAEVTA